MLAFLKKNRIFVFLLGIILLAFSLRTLGIQRNLLYHFDQGLHATDIYKIWHDHKISLLGHISDVDGLIHAPVYYWLMTPAYFLGKGDPAAASVFQILLEVLSLPFLFFALEYFFNRRTAVATLILYTVSFGMISQSRWLSNVTPIIPFSNFLLFCIAHQLKKKRKRIWIFITALTVGIITQLNAAVGVFLFPFLIWYYRKSLKIGTILLLLAGFFIPALPVVLFQFRHDFVLVKAVWRFFTAGGKGLGFSLGVFWTNLRTFFHQVNLASFYPLILVSTTLFLIGLWRVKSQKHAKVIFAFFLIPFLLLGLFQRGAIGFFFDAMLPLAIAVIVYSLEYFPKSISFILFWTILVVNLLQMPYIYKPTNALIPIGSGNVITLQDRKNVIDWMYFKAEGKPFSVWYYTIPYYHEQPWDYLFDVYAKPKYGYLPEATHGFNPKELKTSAYFFAVYEPEFDERRFGDQMRWVREVKQSWGGVSASFRSNDIIVQLRSWRPKAK